jgi:hypothetical protein
VQELDDLRASVIEEAAAVGAKGVGMLDSSCFDGVYVTAEAVGEEYLDKLARTRSSDRGMNSSAAHLLDRLEIPKKARVS